MEHYELSFVNVCDNTEEDVRATNKTVRTHVMRRYKKQQRISKWKRHEKDSRLAADKTMSPKPYAIQCRPSDLKLTTCLDGELDPFHNLPVRLSRREHMLLHHSKYHNSLIDIVGLMSSHFVRIVRYLRLTDLNIQTHHLPFARRCMQGRSTSIEKHAAKILHGFL